MVRRSYPTVHGCWKFVIQLLPGAGRLAAVQAYDAVDHNPLTSGTHFQAQTVRHRGSHRGSGGNKERRRRSVYPLVSMNSKSFVERRTDLLLRNIFIAPNVAFFPIALFGQCAPVTLHQSTESGSEPDKNESLAHLLFWGSVEAANCGKGHAHFVA
jgi:hypothetical protein